MTQPAWGGPPGGLVPEPVPVAEQSSTAPEYLAAVLESVSPLEPLDLVLAEAYGGLLAADVSAPLPVPPFDQGTVDGYAVRSADVQGATAGAPAVLPVVPGPPIGARVVQPGIAVRVSAGRPLPEATELVVPDSWTAPAADGGPPRVAVRRSPKAGGNLRRAGDDVAPGASVLAAGSPLGTVQVALLASLGIVRARVHPRPRVVVLATGDTLLEPGEAFQQGHAYDGVSHALAAACREAGALPYRLPVVPATEEALTAAVEDHLIQADAVLVSALVRPGSADPVLAMLGRLGTAMVHQVAVEPGPVQVLGRLGGDRTPVFVLPAAPVAALVCFEAFVRPALRRMLGSAAIHRPQVTVSLTHALSSPRGRRQYVRATVRHSPARGYLATPVAAAIQTLTSLAASNALVVVPEDAERVAAGTSLPAVLLERRGG